MTAVALWDITADSDLMKRKQLVCGHWTKDCQGGWTPPHNEMNATGSNLTPCTMSSMSVTGGGWDGGWVYCASKALSSCFQKTELTLL